MSRRRGLWLVASGALVLRLVLLLARGDYIVYDEGYYLLLARSLRAGLGFTLNGLPHVSLSPLQPLLVAGLSLVGVPDLWASRLLAAACGAALVFPVAYLAHEWFGERSAVPAAVFVAVSPGLLTFLPFFPGERWNLYFGSEPLYLLLAVGAMAAGWRAVREESGRFLCLAGALCSLSYLTRLEGAVLGAGLALAVVAVLARRRKLGAMVPAASLAALVAVAVASPYFLYLHHALGRWAASGRVQAAQVEAAPAPGSSPGSGGSSAVNAFVWGGNREALWSTLYALDATGTRMASQYWGVPTERVAGPAADKRTGAPGGDAGNSRELAADSRRRERPSASPPPPAPSGTLFRALFAVAPWWFMLLALMGLVWAPPGLDALAFAGAAALAVVLPALLAYVEPRALLLAVPVACVLAGGAIVPLGTQLSRRAPGSRVWLVLPSLIALLLGVPTVRDLVRSWSGTTPLQQVATARRAVGGYLGDHLPRGARIVSWHPAIAIYAGRDWRVLPFDTFGRVAFYARAQHAGVVVMSRFEPSPLRNPPRPFTAILVDSVGPLPGDSLRLAPVDDTPLLFVGRLEPPK